MDLLRTLLVYMSMLVAGAGVNSPVLTPVPQSTVTPVPTAWVTQSPAPSAMPTATATPSLSTLSVNSRGEEVRKMQQRLADLGYLKGRVDGIFGDQTLQAVRNFQRANKLTVDGIAGRNTLNKLYNDPNVVYAANAGPTAAPVNAQLTVFYVSTTGATFNTDTLTLAPGTRTVTPNANKVPRGYVLRSQRSVTVRVDNRGVASPASIAFTYQPPALAQTVNVPIYYRSDTNQLLSQDYIAAPYGQSVTVFAQQNRVPQGFTLLTPAQLTVQVNAQGVPTPSSLTFVYRGPQVVTVMVPVFYRNTQGDLITSTMMTLQPGQHTVAANDALVPQVYTLEGARTQQVNVSAQGTAVPASVTFTYRSGAVTVSLPVQYVDSNGGMLKQDTVSVMTGPNTVTANDALVPGYQLTSARQVSVNVDTNGRATPDKVVFTYKKPAQATVSVLYRDTAGKTLLDTTVTFGEGSHTVIANDSFVPAGYVLESAREVPVTVRADGTVTPASITFTYKAPVVTPTPTPAVTPEPAVTATVELHYRDTLGGLIGAEAVTLEGVGMHSVQSLSTTLGDYVIIDNTPQQVEVLANGTAQPNAVSFVFAIPEAPVVTPDPATITAQVTLNYINAANETLKSEAMELTGVGTHNVQAPTTTIGDYVITDNTPKQVEVRADGTALPGEVRFTFAIPEAPVVTPDPATVKGQVMLYYLNTAGSPIGGTVIELTGVGKHVIEAPAVDTYVISDSGPQQVEVEVRADGTANPSEISFVYDKPVTPEPITEEPVTEPPVTDAPVTDAPVTDAPITDEPTEPAPVAVPEFQAYQDMTIPAGSYIMFTGPGDTYIPSTPDQTYAGGSARVWGSQMGWVMLGYDLDGQGNYRVGYIYQGDLPEDLIIPELSFPYVKSLEIVTDDAILTEDPFGSNTTLQKPIPKSKSVLVYGTVGNYAYVDYITEMVRGFVPKAALNIQ